jgi:hypothetical protein
MGYSNKILAAPPTYHIFYPSNATPYTTSSIAALDHAVKHDFHNSKSTDVIYTLPRVLEYYPDFFIGTDVWIPLREFPSYLYFYLGFGYFDAPTLDVVAATAIPLLSIEVSIRSIFACPVLTS